MILEETDQRELLETDLSQSRPSVRDRIVILGRRRAGKTVFLSRLYERLWRAGEDVHVRALDGAMHERCVEVCHELKDGTWPAATAGSLMSRVELTQNGRRRRMIVLDYPGEVFRRAFVEGGVDDQTRALLEHIDHAAAVMVLIDPGSVHAGDVQARVDDDYGMVQAIDRIRTSDGGKDIPIAIVLTKCDEHVRLVSDVGSPRQFVETRLPNLVRFGGRMRVFASSAVRTRSDAVGRSVPNTEKEPLGVVEPLTYCMKHMIRREALAERSRQEAAVQQVKSDALLRHHAVQNRTHKRVVIIVIACIVVALVAVALTLIATFGGDT